MEEVFTSEDNPSPNCTPSNRVHLNAQVQQQLPGVLTYTSDGKDPSQANCNRISQEEKQKNDWDSEYPPLTHMLSQNISDIHHTDGSIQLCKPIDRYWISVSARKKYQIGHFYSFHSQVL